MPSNAQSVFRDARFVKGIFMHSDQCPMCFEGKWEKAMTLGNIYPCSKLDHRMVHTDLNASAYFILTGQVIDSKSSNAPQPPPDLTLLSLIRSAVWHLLRYGLAYINRTCNRVYYFQLDPLICIKTIIFKYLPQLGVPPNKKKSSDFLNDPLAITSLKLEAIGIFLDSFRIWTARLE